MLEFLISSASRRKTLVCLLNNQDKEFHLRELSRNIGKPAPMVKRELDRLEQIGFVLSWVEGNRRHFKVNRNFLLLPELKSLADKSVNVSSNLKVVNTFILKEILRKRKTWEKRSKVIRKKYGNEIERQRPRHPAEARMLEKI
jgi:predicted transcriptional regulator